MANLKACQLKILILHFLLTFFHGAALESNGFSLKLIPWDSPESPFYQPNLTQMQKLHMMIMSSRARAIIPTPTNETFYSKEIQIPIRNQILRYSVNIKIGNPSTNATLLLDTGSGYIWTKCGQSRSDYPQTSGKYKALSCHHPLCLKGNDICKCIDEECVCSVTYGSPGLSRYHVQGTLSSDWFTLPIKKNRVRNFTDMFFGCSNQSLILHPGIHYSGVLGLNKSPVSLVSQVKNTVKGRYSYCLHEAGGYLRFGNDIPRVGKHAKATKMLPTSFNPLLDLRGISVGRRRLALSPALFSSEEGGLLVDTGAEFTVLKRQAYDEVIQEIENYYDSNLERVHLSGFFLNHCYKIKNSMITHASMTFHLDGADYETDKLYVTPMEGIMCIGLLRGDGWTLGALQQQNTRFVFDINANVLKFAREDCSKDRE